MSEWSVVLLTLGALLIIAVLLDAVGRRTRLPHVTVLVVFGVLIGPSGLDVLPERSERWYPLISTIALLMVGFLLGGKLSYAALKETGREILWISLFEVFGATIAVAVGLLLLGVPVPVALLLAGIAPASAPAATTYVVHELGAEGRFTDTLLGVLAIDDAWGLIAFSFLLAVAAMVSGGPAGTAVLASGLWEVGGAILVGIAVGLPAAYLTGRLRPGEPTLNEAIGVVLVCGGAALWLDVSFLLAAMVTGAVIVNLASHHERPFHAIENIEWPFMVLFFVLAGASLHVDELLEIGLVGATYVGLRALGLYLGAWAGGALVGWTSAYRHWIGAAMLPQAGVALGLALIAGNRFPELRDTIIPIVVGSTVIFELMGPLFTRLALIRVGEAGAAEQR